MATETQRPSFFDTATEDDVSAVPAAERPIGGDVPVVPTSNNETVSLGVWVLYKGNLASREGGEFIGFVTQVHENENEVDLLLVAPGKGWSPGAEAFRQVRAPVKSVRRLLSKYRVGQSVVFRVRDDQKTETLGTGYKTGAVERRANYLDPETDEVKNRVVRTPGIETPPPLFKGSVYHRSMVSFGGLIIYPYTDDSVDLLIFVPQAAEPVLVRGVFEGEGPGTFALVD